MTDTRPMHERPLYTLLSERLDHVREAYVGNRLDARSISILLNVHRYTVYRWLAGDLSLQGARKIIELSKGKITREELTPFILS